LQINHVKKFLLFTNNSTTNPKPFFSRFCFNDVYGRFLARGVQKHDQNKNVTKTNPTHFFFLCTLTHPPAMGVTENKIAGPCLGVFQGGAWKKEDESDVHWLQRKKNS
jgi:hypothetical protein